MATNNDNDGTHFPETQQIIKTSLWRVVRTLRNFSMLTGKHMKTKSLGSFMLACSGIIFIEWKFDSHCFTQSNM